ncbi:MAG: tRNA pseudouridine(55) synthase TruB, partial [Bacillota bacterium]|nr:tRNA pseudouridine(55) synthase TruB [Bacillota bacterium]
MEGILPLFKPAGLTSHDCIFKLRKILKTKKVGHTGTLDPDVTGVLPVCIG